MGNITVSVIGGGSWGTALVQLLSDNGHEVRWWLRSEANVQHIKLNHHNPAYLSSASLNLDRIHVSNDLIEVLKGSEWVIIAVPAAYLHSALKDVPADALQGKTVVSAVKGIIPETLLTVADYLIANKGLKFEDIGVIGGPCHSEEVAMQKLSYLTVAFQDERKAQTLAGMLRNRYMHVSTTHDVTGMEYAAVLKNVYAIGSGIAHGLGYGDNFQAVLVVSSMDEMIRFLKAVNGLTDELNLRHYTGDLIVTAYSAFSRNRRFGSLVGKGYNLKSILAEMEMVAEGYFASRSVHELNKKLGLDLPISDMVYRVLHKNSNPARCMQELAQQMS